MNAHVQQTAIGFSDGHNSLGGSIKKRQAIIVIDGIEWYSQFPQGTPDATEYNFSAERIVEAVKRV